MNRVSAEDRLDGLAQQLPKIAQQLSIIHDVASNLRVACDWYDNPDPQYGGPPSLNNLKIIADYLQGAYMELAELTGLDPCEQFEETKVRLKILRNNRIMTKFVTENDFSL